MSEASEKATRKRAPRPLPPVSSFPAEYLAAWKEATKREVRLNTKDTTGKKRDRLRQDLNTFRRAFESEFPEEGELLRSAMAVLDRHDKKILILRPKALDVAEMFEEAGISVEDPFLLSEGRSSSGGGERERSKDADEFDALMAKLVPPDEDEERKE